MKTKSTFLFFGIWIACEAIRSGGLAQAQTGDAGGGSPFSIGYSARALAMGNTQAACPKDPTAFYWNPGALVVVDQTGVAFSHTLLFEGVIYSSVAMVHPTMQTGSFGIGLAAVGIGGIQRMDEINGVPVSLGEMQYWWAKLTVSYALTIWKGISVGVNFNEHRQVLGPYSTYGFGMDAGLHLRFPQKRGPLHNVLVGASVNNALPAKLKLGSVVETEPYSVRVGLAKIVTLGGGHGHWILSGDVNGNENQFKDRKPVFHAGTEMQWNEFLYVRAGLDDGAPVFGGGLRIPHMQFNAFGLSRFDLQMDYAYAQIGDPEFFPKSHRFSLEMYFGHSIPERRRLQEEAGKMEVQRKIEEQRESDRQKRIKEGLAAGKDFLAKDDYFHARLELARVLTDEAGNLEAQNLLNETTEKERALQQRHEDEILLAAQESEKRRQDMLFVGQRFQDGLDALNRSEYAKAMENWQLALERDPGNAQIRSYMDNTKVIVEKEILRLVNRSKQLEQGENLTEAYQLMVQARDLSELTPNQKNGIQAEFKRLDDKIGFVNAFKAGFESYEKGDFQASARHLEKALAHEPGNARTQELYRNAKARSIGVSRSTNMPQAAKEKFSDGLKFYQDGRYQDAIVVWEEGLILDPNNIKMLDAIQAAKDKLASYKSEK
jgi:tetratricopeptide (TPR) repeat protein